MKCELNINEFQFSLAHIQCAHTNRCKSLRLKLRGGSLYTTILVVYAGKFHKYIPAIQHILALMDIFD